MALIINPSMCSYADDVSWKLSALQALTNTNAMRHPNIVTTNAGATWKAPTDKIPNNIKLPITPGAGAYSSSRTWKAPVIQVRDRNVRQLKNTVHAFPHSPFIKNLELVPHVQDLQASIQRTMRIKIAVRTRELEVQAAIKAKTKRSIKLTPFGGKIFTTNHSAVCVEETIWCSHEKEVTASWPCSQEFKFEGDDRVASDALHGRFLPLPRKPAENETVSWNQLEVVKQFPFDRVAQLPSVEDSWFMRFDMAEEREIGDDEAKEMLGVELWSLLEPNDMFDV